MAHVSEAQPTLFADENGVDAPFVLTNRYNLLEFLASRLVAPRSSFDKYYRDLFELCEGRIPLLTPPFEEDVQALVSAEDPRAAFPVAIEIDRGLITDSVPAAQFESAKAWAPTGAIPFECVVAVHFRSDDELQEHLAREYENVRQPEARLRVTPGLFASSGATGARADWLRSLPIPSSEVDAVLEDRRSGAISLMAHLCPAWDELIETLRRVLQLPVRGKRGKSHAGWIVDALSREVSGDDGATLDSIVLSEAMAVFLDSDPQQSWRSSDVLAAVQAAVEPRLSPGDREANGRYFERIRQILASERPFERLKPGGHPSEKALLMALMRPDPRRLAAWDVEESGADWQSLLGAAALVGGLRGRRRMPIELRGEPMDDYLSMREALAASGAESPKLSNGAKPSIRTARARDGHRVSLTSGGADLRSWTPLGPAPVPPVTADQLRSPALAERLADICEESGWTDCLTLTVSAVSPPQESEEPSGQRSYHFVGQVRAVRGVDADRMSKRLEQSTDGDTLARVRKLLD